MGGSRVGCVKALRRRTTMVLKMTIATDSIRVGRWNPYCSHSRAHGDGGASAQSLDTPYLAFVPRLAIWMLIGGAPGFLATLVRFQISGIRPDDDTSRLLWSLIALMAVLVASFCVAAAVKSCSAARWTYTLAGCGWLCFSALLILWTYNLGQYLMWPGGILEVVLFGLAIVLSRWLHTNDSAAR